MLPPLTTDQLKSIGYTDKQIAEQNKAPATYLKIDPITGEERTITGKEADAISAMFWLGKAKGYIR